MPRQSDDIKNNMTSSDSACEVPMAVIYKHPSGSEPKVKSELFKITVTEEMYSSGKFCLEKKEFKGRSLPVVKTTVEAEKYNGAWIFSVDENIVALCDLFEVRDNLVHELKRLKQVTLSVYFAKRPSSYFPDKSRQVGVSINLINMSEIDTMKQTFHARFNMKTIWEPSPEEVANYKEKGYHSTGSGWRPRFIFPNCTEIENRRRFEWPVIAKEFMNTTEPFILSKYLLRKDGELDPYGSVLNILPEYIMYGELEFHGTFSELLELKAFPLDCQDFSIICWSNGILAEQQIVSFDLFLGDKDINDHNSEGFTNLPLCEVHLSTSNVTSEWDIQNVHVSLEKRYRSNMYVIIKARRRYNLYLWRIFIPVFLLVLGCQVAFLISIKHGEERLNLVFTAVLANVVYQLAVYGELPQIPYMTFVDWYNLFYFVLMLLILLESSIAVFHNEVYFDIYFHSVNETHLRGVDLQWGVVLLVVQLLSGIFFAIWGYNIEQAEEKKLSLNYYDQVRAGIIKAPKVNFELNSTEREHEEEIRENKQEPYGWLKDYKAKVQV